MSIKVRELRVPTPEGVKVYTPDALPRRTTSCMTTSCSSCSSARNLPQTAP